MFCKSGIFVNWGNIPAQEIEFGPINLFSGGNGSGKTTAADGLQALMTAAHENLFNFNPGQDETTQRGRGGKNVRTLASYILGCDDGSYARMRAADGYLAGNFQPTQGESGERFCAVMCVRASLDTAGNTRHARQDELQFLIIPNEQLSLSDFVKEDSGGQYVVSMTEVANLLKQKFGRNAIEVYDKKGPYLRRLYGIFRGEKNAVSDREAKHAARTFANFMAYKPVKSISDFVAREILEPKDLSDDIRQVSELMKTIHSMEEDTRKINESIHNLQTAQTASNSYIDSWIQHSLSVYSEATRLLNVKQKDYVQSKQQQSELTQAIVDLENSINFSDDKRKHLQDDYVELLAQRQGIVALKDKDQLERDIERLNRELGQKATPLLVQDQQLGKNIHAAIELKRLLTQNSIELEIPTLSSNKTSSLLKPLIDQKDDNGIDIHALLNKDWVDDSAMQQKLELVLDIENEHNALARYLHSKNTNGSSPSDQVYLSVHRKKEARQKTQNAIQNKEHEIQKLTLQSVSYPAAVETALAAIRDNCPEAQPCVLCDYIEISDPQWQMAIEGYLGGARFGIVVEPEYEADAIRIVRKIGGKRSNARVIQGSKASRDAARLKPVHGSIVEIMDFEHKIVEYYMQASYGSVKRVASTDELKHTSRGLCVKGMGSGNYSMFRCDMDEGDLVFGKAARKRALQAKQLQLNNLLAQAQADEDNYQALSKVQQSLSQIQALQCADAIRDLIRLNHDLKKTEARLGSLDLTEHKALEQSLSELKHTIEESENLGRSQLQELGSVTNKLESNARQLTKISSELDTLQVEQESKESSITAIAQHNAQFNSEQALAQVDDSLSSSGQASFTNEIEDYWNSLDRHERHLYERVIEHNRNCQNYNAIPYNIRDDQKHSLAYFGQINSLMIDVERQLNALKNNVLVGKHEKLLALKDSFNTTFVTNLCHSIFQSISDGKRILEELNKELEHHRFGADKERFYFAYEWLPEFKEYWRFFDELIKTPSLGDGSTLFDIDLSERSAVIRDKLLSMLLDKDEQSALIELRKISDYRNYRRYEIFKEPENKAPIPLSTYGTGSGGQLETPAYIIRSAAITSAFRFNEGKSHCRMVLVDEAFSKMDETRSREVIHYLTETLGLQLIFIMPSSKSGPFMDLISHQVVFSKCPSNEKIGELNTQVLVDRKVCNQEKIKDLWANHRRTIRNQGNLDFMEEFI
jgi:energy-coupling factor transporter ATP-binding protein EcfA2